MHIDRLTRISVVSNRLEIPRSTIVSAIERGEIVGYMSECQFPMVVQKDVEQWATRERKRGPKVKKAPAK